MPQERATVAVRMYNPGFGDAFLVTVQRDGQVWRMLVDCGAHSQGQARPIKDVVRAIISDLTAVAPAGSPPHLDVLVATHHHADHIKGFADDAWEAVDVGQVWVPFVEDPSDPDAQALRAAHATTASRLLGLIQTAQARAAGDAALAGAETLAGPETLENAAALALNSLGNADATDRLLGRNGRHFLNRPDVVFLPHLDRAHNRIETGLAGVVVQVLGPPRDPEELKDMDPPASVAWLQLRADRRQPSGDGAPLFNGAYTVEPGQADGQVSPELLAARPTLRLDELADDDAALLGASAILERAVNNTSVFFVLDATGIRLLFPGDAQQGAWDHVLNDDDARRWLTGLAFYKIGHHGSHNATPRRFVEQLLGEGVVAMLPWGPVERWKASIPKAELIEALHQHDTHLISAHSPQSAPQVQVNGTLWSEVTLSAP